MIYFTLKQSGHKINSNFSNCNGSKFDASFLYRSCTFVSSKYPTNLCYNPITTTDMCRLPDHISCVNQIHDDKWSFLLNSGTVAITFSIQPNTNYSPRVLVIVDD